MTEEQFHRGLRMIRVVGILLTLMFFAAGTAFATIIPTPAGMNSIFGQIFPYVILVTVIIAVLSVATYFVYSAIQRPKVTRA